TTLNDALSLQSEIAAEVSSQLSVTLVGGGAPEAPSKDPEAYDLYLRAMLKVPLIGEPQARFAEVIQLLDQAIARDPRFVLAHLARHEAHGALIYGNYDTSEKRFALARADLEALQQLAPDDPGTLAAQAAWSFHIDQNYDAVKQLQRVVGAGYNEALIGL